MADIIVIHDPDQEHLEELDVFNWPIWTKEVSEFPWEYDTDETCYLLEGEVTVTPEGGNPVQIQKNDLVTFPQGMKCIWKITKDVRKHYTLG
ncbi:MAG: cupin domain-containing protein [Anaerolineales bacterium]